MCYAPSAMLRGRCSCAISDRPTASSALRLLATSHSLARRSFGGGGPLATALLTPLFPLDTQKQGGRGVSFVASFASLTSFASFSAMTTRSISEFSTTRSSAAPIFSAFSLRSSAHSAPLSYLFCCLSALRGESTFFSGLCSPNCRIPAKNAKSANITFRLSIIIINKCRRADNFHRTNLFPYSSQSLCPLCSCLCDLCVTVPLSSSSAVGCELLFSPNSNHSRTSGTFVRKSNHSRTYAKTGGWGVPMQSAFSHNSFVFSRHSNYILNYMITNIVGAPTFLCFAAPISCSRMFLNLKLTTDHSKLLPPCSQGQRGGLGEYRPSECSTRSEKEGVLGTEAKGVPPGEKMMQKPWLLVALVAMSVSAGAGRAAAQGPAGVGATAAAESSSHAPRSYNPIKWVKKDPKPGSDWHDANSQLDKNLTAKLQGAGVLAASTNIAEACGTFKVLSDCLAGLHASHSLALDFNCVKSDMTGVQTGANMSACKEPKGDKATSLSKTIQLLKPGADAKAEAKNAEKQASEDLKEAGS